MSQIPILIVGAGPTGLVLAMELAHYNVPFRIIDKAKGPGETSRAMLVVPKVLESYQKYGLAETVTQQGIVPQFAYFHVDNKRIASLPLGEMGKGLSSYPYLVTFPQDEHEKVLIEKLNTFGIRVEWETELVSLTQHADQSEVTLYKKQEKETACYRYVVGCDGASSEVRKQSATDFEGNTYEQIFYVMDAKVTGQILEEESGSFSFKTDYFALFFPLRNKQTSRMIGMFPPDLAAKNDLRFESLKPRLEEAFQLSIEEMNWFSDYKVHRRTASRFKMSNHFLIGDAAHIHSPVGGQGMNLGIGDAVNLGWKLAYVLNKRAPEALLDTYEEERRDIAEFVASTTDGVFGLIVGNKTKNRLTRQLLIPVIARAAGIVRPFQKRLFILLSQLYVSYEDSPLSSGGKKDRGSSLKAGRRLPYVASERMEYTREDGWQLHTFHPLDEDLRALSEEAGIETVLRKWTDKARDKGFKKDQWLLVRPDGYIGWTGTESDKGEYEQYLTEWLRV